MADVRVYDDVKNPREQRELIGVLRECQFPTKDDPSVMRPGYMAMLQLNAEEDRTKLSAAHNPKGAGNLNLRTSKYTDKDGVERYGHNGIYSEAQGKAMIEAAGKNVAPRLGADGKKTGELVIAFRADLVESRDKKGLAVNTSKPMNASEIESFGKSGAKARNTMTHQYDEMRGYRDKAAEMEKDAEADRTVNDPVAEQRSEGMEMDAEPDMPFN